MKKRAKVALLGSFLVLLACFVAVESDYQKHQKPTPLNELSIEALVEYQNLYKKIEIKPLSMSEINAKYIEFLKRGEVAQTNALSIGEKIEIMQKMDEIRNPLTRKSEGFGYAVYKFLGVVK